MDIFTKFKIETTAIVSMQRTIFFLWNNLCQRNIDNGIGIISKNIISLSKDKYFPIQQVSASKPIYFYTRHHIPWKPNQHYQLTHSFVRCISNLPSASDRKLCFTFCQLKSCRTGNDKSIYSKIPNLSLVNFDIDISVSLSHAGNIESVLYILFTLRSSPFITAWTPDDVICLGGGCACGFICCNAACSSTPRHIRLSTGLFTGSSCASTLPLSTDSWIGGRILPVPTPVHRGVFSQSSNILGNKVSSLVINWAFKVFPVVINWQVRNATDILGLLSEALHGQFVLKCNRVGLYEKALCKI